MQVIQFKKVYLSLVIIICVMFQASTLSAKSIKIGFVGGRSVEGCVRQWTPLLDYLTREVGVPFEMVLREDYEGLIDALTNGEIDMYEGGAFSHVAAMATGGADILVGETRLSQRTYRSIFIVRAGDNFHELADLRGKRLALTDELSTSGYLLPRIMLARAGIDRPDDFFKQIVLTGSHDRSIDALLDGAIDAAAVGDFFITFLPPDKRAEVRIILTSDPIPAGPITIRKGFDVQTRGKIVSALLSFDKKVPENIRRVTEIDSFYIQGESAYNVVRAYKAEFGNLPGLSYIIPPYHRMPAVIKDRIAKEKKSVLFWMIGAFALLVVLWFFAAFSFRRSFSTSIGLATAVIVSVLAVLFTVVHVITTFSSLNSFSTEKLGGLENTNLRAITAIEGGQAGILDKILLNATDNNTVVWANIFRNGYIIASSDENEVGTSVIDQIKMGTFRLPQVKLDKDIVLVQDPIIVNGRTFAMLQVGITFRPIAARVKKAITINFIVVAAAMLAGLFAAFLAKKRLARPIRTISEAIERLREGDKANIEGVFSDVGQVATSINRLGKELEEKQLLQDLRSCEAGQTKNDWDPEVTRELEERITAMEAENESFRRLRMTEAIGHSPAWLRTLRDAAIRARDRDPVVIFGLTGTGKTGIARVIHSLSPRSDRKFGEFNCAEFASGDPLIVLGKLFGYGIDTGIQGIDRHGQTGVLEGFDGGTLFLDEAEVLPPQAQQLLLLPLEGRPFNPAAGKSRPRAVNIRFILATNEPLETLTHSGRMRKDLLRRILARGVVSIPTLAERSEDIELLAFHFLAQRNASSDKKLSFGNDAIGLIAGLSFNKYNVSELKGMVDHAFDRAIFDGEAKIEPTHLGGDILRNATDNMKLYDEEERRELAALRRDSFNITLAGKRLGYAPGSKTLTNRFRGLAYRVLEGKQWDTDAAVAEIVGPNPDRLATERVSAKIDDYIATARRNLAAGSARKIFNNLPKKCHPSAEKFLVAVGNGLIKGLFQKV